jgi:hypothetical protein
MAQTPQQAYNIQRARERAKTQGHAARRSIDQANRKAGRKEARKEQAERQKFEGSIPIWGARDPDTNEYRFRPGAKKGWWEDRPNDWTGTQRDAAEGQASWTKIDHAQAARQPNNVGFLTGKVLGAVSGIGSKPKGSSGLPAQAQGSPLPPPVMPPGLPPRQAPASPAGGGGGPGAAGGGQQGQPMQHHWLHVKPGSGLPSGGGQATPTAGALGTGQLGLPWGGQQRSPGQSRVLTGQRPRGALGTGSPALGRGPVIDTTARDSPSNYGNKSPVLDLTEDAPDDSEHMRWAAAAGKRVAFAVDPKNKIPLVDSRLEGTGRGEAQKAKYNAAWAKSGTDMPSVHGDEPLEY